MSKGLFITGTGTDLGKTYIAGLIVKKLADAKQSAAYYKAAMSRWKSDSGRCVVCAEDRGHFPATGGDVSIRV